MEWQRGGARECRVGGAGSVCVCWGGQSCFTLAGSQQYDGLARACFCTTPPPPMYPTCYSHAVPTPLPEPCLHLRCPLPPPAQAARAHTACPADLLAHGQHD